jgi:hypothetical protein
VYVEERTVDVHIRRLRKALEPFACDSLGRRSVVQGIVSRPGPSRPVDRRTEDRSA